jgi:hypothetical protein
MRQSCLFRYAAGYFVGVVGVVGVLAGSYGRHFCFVQWHLNMVLCGVLLSGF